MISKILALEALIGTIRAHLPVPVRNVSDITPEQHSHEIINAIELLADKDKQLAEARAEIERLALLAQNQQIVIDAQSRSIQAKDALIEQMREALRLADDLIDEYAAVCEHADNVDELRDEIKAALSAAERGEG